MHVQCTVHAQVAEKQTAIGTAQTAVEQISPGKTPTANPAPTNRSKS